MSDISGKIKLPALLGGIAALAAGIAAAFVLSGSGERTLTGTIDPEKSIYITTYNGKPQKVDKLKLPLPDGSEVNIAFNLTNPLPDKLPKDTPVIVRLGRASEEICGEPYTGSKGEICASRVMDYTVRP